jgi:hypothetical protein
MAFLILTGNDTKSVFNSVINCQVWIVSPCSDAPHSPIPSLPATKIGKELCSPPFFDNLFKTIVDAQQSRLKLH